MTLAEAAKPATAPVRAAASEAGDRVFRRLVTATGGLVVVLIVAILVFLLSKAAPAIGTAGVSFLTEREWFPDASPPVFGIAALVFGTLLSSALALILALPVALGTSLFVVELAPRRLGRAVGSLVDLLAAVPSVVYGLWGVFYLVPLLIPVQQWLDRWLGFIPLFDNTTGAYGRSIFAAAVVLAIMVLPIISALTREIFLQVPRSHREAALALGATRWEVIRVAVLPYGRSGVIGASMLGLGRALGETIAVALVLAASFDISVHILEPGGNTIAANIATKFGEAGEQGREALIASGLVLFAVTFIVNGIARAVVYRNSPAAKAKRA